MSCRSFAAAAIIVAACAHSAPSPANQTMFSKADAYDQFMGRWSRLLALELVHFADVHDGAILDVGSGTGVLSFAARAQHPNDSITGIDLSPDYVAYARHVQQASQARPITFEVGDAQHLTFGDATFATTLSLLVINFVPAPVLAATEMKRVTKPGGTVAAVVWDYGAGMEMLRVFWDEVDAFDPAVEPHDEKHMPLCRSGELTALWRQVGFTDVEEAPLSVTQQFTSFADYWTPFELGQGPAGAYVAALPPARRAELEHRVRVRLIGDGPDRPITLHARAWAVKGRVPG